MMQLNLEQLNVVQFAASGHNVVITGQAGVGKSRVVKAIVQNCHKSKRKVALVCSSGIACTVYESGLATTVHSYYGLQTADLPWKQVVERAVTNAVLQKKLRAVDVIIWDEASMSSRRMLELVDAIHHQLAIGDNSREMMPFAGKQLIIVGEFLQLRPVPNSFDDGDFMFKSSIFDIAIPHRFQLSTVMRQSQRDGMLLKTLKELRLGLCSEETAFFISRLARGLDGDGEDIPTHIFFKKIPAMLFNRSVLEELPGELLRFEASFKGQYSGALNWPGQNTLLLKENCRVMLVWNKSSQLKNGCIGVFKGVMEKDDTLRVWFEDVGTVSVGRETWFRRNRQGDVVGSVSQFPIVLAYAITCHKSQGLTLPSAVIHCSKEFVPGLTYVALSRVKSSDQLQVLNFSPDQLLPPDPTVIEQSSTSTAEATPDLECCRHQVLENDQLFSVHDRYDDFTLDDEPSDISFHTDICDGIIRASFERDDVQSPVSFIQIYEELQRSESDLSRPPNDALDVDAELKKLRPKSCPSDFARAENEVVDVLSTPEYTAKVDVFINLIWYHSFLLVKENLVENPDHMILDIAKAGFTEATGKLHQLLRSEDFTRYVCGLFSTCTAPQRTVAVRFATAIYWKFLGHLESVIFQDRAEEAIVFNVEEMSAAGRAKLRHVGGWAIKKVLETSRKNVRRNLSSTNADTLKTVQRHHAKSELIENYLIAPFAKLHETSAFKETLQVTEARQFRERGLIHIDDEAYGFFVALEGQGVQLLNRQRLHTEKETMVEAAYQDLLENTELQSKWFACFGNETEDRKDEINELFTGVVRHYIHMGAAQYLRDFKRMFHLKRTAELRKRVLQRQQINQEKKDSVPFKQIMEDRSPGKATSHARLVSFVFNHGVIALGRAYLKSQLQSLCEAYEVPFQQKSTKKILAQGLMPAVQRNTSIPLIFPVDNRNLVITETVYSDNEPAAIRIRLSTRSH